MYAINAKIKFSIQSIVNLFSRMFVKAYIDGAHLVFCSDIIRQSHALS